MWALAFILPLSVVLAHQTYGWLGRALEIHPAVVFYAQTGWLLAVLSGAVVWLASEFKLKPSPGRINWNGIKTEWIYVAMGMNATEGLMMNCILLGPVEGNACDYHAKLPIGATLTALWLFMFVWVVVKNVKRRPPKHPEPLRRAAGPVRE